MAVTLVSVDQAQAVVASHRWRRAIVGVTAATHAAALFLMLQTEAGLVPSAGFLLTWGVLNFFWLCVFRRPSCAAILSLAGVVALVLLSRFKHDKLWLTVDFIDLLVVDRDTASFLLILLPGIRAKLAAVTALVVMLLALLWRCDPFRIRRSMSLSGLTLTVGAIALLSIGIPALRDEEFFDGNYVSRFARTSAEGVYALSSRGYLDAAPASSSGGEAIGEGGACKPVRPLPHIVLLHDESSFDVTAAPGIKVPPRYSDFFVSSSDGQTRKLVVEGAGGPSWFTEFNVLTGLSARSFGVFATAVTRIAAGRVERGLPLALRRCGYQTYSLYPFYGAFLGSRAFQQTAGIGHYLDMKDLRTRDFEADRFYFDRAVDILTRRRGTGPLFLYVYTVANHFPWDSVLRPDLTPGWRAQGNARDVDEYIRRQRMTADDYEGFLQRLRSEFPGEPFLIVRYGDHQPSFGRRIVDPNLTEDQIGRAIGTFDARYFTTYYAIDAVNFVPADLASAVTPLDAPYLPLVTLEAAGVPLDPSFRVQRRALDRCNGVFFRCEGGEVARMFNRQLLDAGLISGL